MSKAKILITSALCAASFYAGTKKKNSDYTILEHNNKVYLQTPAAKYPVYDHGVGTLEQRMQSLLVEDVSEMRRILKKFQSSNPTSKTQSKF